MLKRQNPDYVQYCICQVVRVAKEANRVDGASKDPYEFVSDPSMKRLVEACPAILDRDNWVYHSQDGINELTWELIRASRDKRVWITEKARFVEHLRFEESIRYKQLHEFSPLETKIGKACLTEIEGEIYRRAVKALYRTNSSTAYCIGMLEDVLSSEYGRKRDVTIDGDVVTISIEYLENEEEVDVERLRSEFPQFSEIITTRFSTTRAIFITT
jgi:hypothetical protein